MTICITDEIKLYRAKYQSILCCLNYVLTNSKVSSSKSAKRAKPYNVKYRSIPLTISIITIATKLQLIVTYYLMYPLIIIHLA